MIYATGDLARYLHDGQIECLGRNDGQVKVRGYRIELGEIETQLKKINLISDAVVVTSEYRAGDVRIVAYIISKDFNESDIRLNLAKTLPSYMVPNHFVLLTDIPKTLNGKVDKKQLPPFQGAAEQVSVKEVQINKEKLENAEFYEQIRKLWEKVLGKNEVSDEDNFFNIGGNSLLAVQIFSKLDTVFKINLPLASLIEAEDFKAFAQIVMEARPTKSISVKKFDTNEIFNSLVKISNKGDLAPLFCFHAAGGNVLNYVGLIPALKSKRPLYALQSLGLDGKSTPRDSIVKMAIAYIEEIKRAQPEGPYNLAGGSMGGTMALEVAIRLRAAGDEVERLILFDTFGPKFNLKKYTKRKSNYFFQKIELLKFVSKGVFTDLLISICNKVGLKAPLVVSLYQVEMNNYRALWKYRPGTYEGDVHLIRCKITEEGWYSDPLLGWKDTLLGQMHIHEISSSHEEFIESPALIGALTKIIN
jgi:thioesterase domain-containing protein/acyl carrier protein